MWGILLLGMVFITSGLEVRRGTIWCNRGEADVVSNFALVKIDTGLITGNEEHLEKLRFALLKLKEVIHDEETVKTISELNKAIVDELFYDTPRSLTTKKVRKV